MIKPKIQNQDGKELAKGRDADTLLLFTVYEKQNIAAFLKGGRLIRVFTEGQGLPVGTVAIAKISEIKAEINSAFLLLKDKQKAYIPLSECTAAVNLTHPGKECKCGDNLLIKIKKEPAKGKLATATTAFTEDERAEFSQDIHRTDFSILKYGENYIFKALNAVSGEENIRLITDREEIYRELNGEIEAGKLKLNVSEIMLYRDELVKVNVLYGLHAKIEEALSRKVLLKSGASVVFDYTEAMTVIDVNSGKSASKKEAKEEFYSINKEAGEEIVRQIVLRNLSGIILIDFINLKDRESRDELMTLMKEWSTKYGAGLNVIDYTLLGIMEVTRSKTGKTLFEYFKV